VEALFVNGVQSAGESGEWRSARFGCMRRRVFEEVARQKRVRTHRLQRFLLCGLLLLRRQHFGGGFFVPLFVSARRCGDCGGGGDGRQRRGAAPVLTFNH
jgi:hypothetical protein